MEVPFSVDGTPATFRWSRMTGRAEIIRGEEVFTLQTPGDLSSHYAFKTERKWQVTINGHDVRVTKRCPRLFSVLRPHTAVVSVDGETVATATGR